MTALPPIGSRVRTMAGDVGIVDHNHDPWVRGWEACVDLGTLDFPWVTADEIEALE